MIEYRFIEGSTKDVSDGMGGHGRATVTDIFAETPYGQAFICSEHLPYSGDDPGWLQCRCKKEKIRSEVAKERFQETDGKYLCEYGLFTDPREFLRWVESNIYTFSPQWKSEMFTMCKRSDSIPFLIFWGNLVQYSAAFRYFIYDPNVMDEVTNMAKKILERENSKKEIPMAYYNICPHCGGHLDPGERCDCQQEGQEPERQETADEKEEVQLAMTNIIKVQFFKGGTPAGKEYSYYTPEQVDVGDIVDIGTRHGTARAMVTKVDVPEAEIAAFKPAVKTIVGKSACRCEDCAEFTAIGEGDHICGMNPHKMPVSDYAPTEDYFWCKGANFCRTEG